MRLEQVVMRKVTKGPSWRKGSVRLCREMPNVLQWGHYTAAGSFIRTADGNTHAPVATFHTINQIYVCTRSRTPAHAAILATICVKSTGMALSKAAGVYAAAKLLVLAHGTVCKDCRPLLISPPPHIVGTAVATACAASPAQSWCFTRVCLENGAHGVRTTADDAGLPQSVHAALINYK